MNATPMLLQIVFSRKCQRAFVAFEDAFVRMQPQMASQRVFAKRPIANRTWNFVTFRNIPFVQHLMENAFSFRWSSTIGKSLKKRCL